MQKKHSGRGTSLIDLLISMGIIAVLFGGVYLVYFSLVAAVANVSVRTAATSAIQAEIETIRNLPYDSVGTVGGVPSGVIPQSQVVSVGKYSFTLQTTVRNIDDPFDGTVSGNPPPVDTAPADYKLVSIQATCALCSNFGSLTVTTTVAPKNLESATQNGSLFVSALNANGISVPAAVVHVVNTSVSPSIDLTDTTNASGVLQLVGVPTSTQGYQITVTKAGYSTEQTYPPGAPGNPNPTKPNATVVAQTLTSVSFAIDKTSALTVYSSDNRCAPVGNESFSIAGAKTIGASPTVLKFSTTSATTASGSVTFANLEWDTYALSLNDATKNLAGTIPLSPLIINPSSTVNFRFVVQSAANPSLLVATIDSATGAGISQTAITASTTGFSKTLTTSHATLTQADWSGGQYASQSGGIDANTSGRITLLTNASGTYNPGMNDWLLSNTFDLGGSSSTLYTIAWNPAVQASASTTAQFQVAANNDNATWSFIGPDGTAGTYFTVSSTSLPSPLSGNRYLRYKVYLNTQDKNFAPVLTSVLFDFSANCVPPAQSLFVNLPQGNYTITAVAQNYAAASTTISVGPGAQSTTVSLVHL